MVNNASIKARLTVLALASMSAFATHAQEAAAGSLAAAVQKAISNNPEVTARLNALRASASEIDVAKGAYRPRVDLSAEVGRTRDRITSRSPESQSLSRNGLALSANQVLWDGESTRSEVERLGHARMTRYFEFLATSEDTALEAARAYIDVQRFRKQHALAEENYVQHKYAFDQLQSKFKAGVGRGVDSEQANARLALSESNLTTETANLHDVSARYMRIVGEAPASNQAATTGLERGVASGNADSINQALAKSASVSAAVENLRAVQAQASGKESAYQPKVEARVRSGLGKNFDGVQDQKRDTSAEIVLNWNLYNGGSDQARVRQYTDLINQAADQRDKACRDVRQTAAIAHNDIKKLKDQLTALDRNVLAIEKARDAYRQQFEIGQRSLLDLLNAENELYTAKRSYANAEFDLQLAYARVQASRGTLTSALGVARAGEDLGDLGKDWGAANEAAQRCPATSIEVTTTSREELDARARKLMGSAATATPVVAAAPAATALAPKDTGTADAAAVNTVQERLYNWARAWMSKDTGNYFGYYSKDFAPGRDTHESWMKSRKRLVTKAGPIAVNLSNVRATPQKDTVVTIFDQTYISTNFKDKSTKVLAWRKEGDQWVIVRESNR
jgi:outer membrane protein, adhesin transport system